MRKFFLLTLTAFILFVSCKPDDRHYVHHDVVVDKEMPPFEVRSRMRNYIKNYEWLSKQYYLISPDSMSVSYEVTSSYQYTIAFYCYENKPQPTTEAEKINYNSHISATRDFVRLNILSRPTPNSTAAKVLGYADVYGNEIPTLYSCNKLIFYVFFASQPDPVVYEIKI